MAAIVTDLSPSSLAVAVKANMYAFFQALGRSSQATVLDTARSFRWHTAIEHPWFNGVLAKQPPADDAPQMIDEALSFFQAHHVAVFTWWLAPHLETAGWAQHLLSHGFQFDDHTPGMAVDLHTLAPPAHPNLTIRPVEDSQTLATWAHTFVQGYGIPTAMLPGFLSLIESLGINWPFRHYLGLLDDQPVAASTLFLGAGVAGIYNVATIPEARGQGFGSALTLVPLCEARDLGYHVGVLQSSDMGYSVYRRLGFQRACQIENFSWSAHHAEP